ncbi:proton-conducting transporter membrane subunit [Halomicrobium salinisoli]|uniref:proton-conducting transporter transmembrane domain-containing protein n=1 Tax=Halomicrobium salinisoli TaxID=2878391 RepID=UPI001CF0882E|nr:proton-conducting transporter membrane subunit [Halomicrobium salinisoli]
MTDVLLPLMIVAPILAATLALLLGLRYDRAGWPVAAGTTTVLVGMAAALARAVYPQIGGEGGRVIHELGGWERPYGIELVADELSAALVVLITLVSLATLVFARVAGPRGNAFYAGYLLLTGGVLGVALTGDMFNMFVFLEITGLTTYALVASDRAGASAYAALKYLMVGTVGASLYLIGVGYVFLATGSLNMIDLRSAIAEVGYTDPLIQAGFAFVVAGFALKIALFPMHTWQPDAYQRAPDAVTTYISALVSTAAAYALLRVTYTVFTVEFLARNDAITTGVMIAAGISIVAGSALAAMQTDLKRTFAYSSVAQFGMIAAAAMIANETALLGAIVHLLGHGLMKFGLFLAVGMLGLGYGVETIDDLASLARRAPYTTGAMTVLGLALVGVPPSIGMLGKWYIALGAVESGAAGDPAGLAVAGVIFVSTLLTLAYVGRIVEQLYFAGVDETGHDEGVHAADGGVAEGDRVAEDERAADDSVGLARPAEGAPEVPIPGVPDRVPPASLAVLVGATLAAVGLGFAGFLAFELFEPFIQEVFAYAGR